MLSLIARFVGLTMALCCAGSFAHAQRWEALDSIDVTRRIGGASCVWDGKGYAGFGHDHNIQHPFNDVWSYDPAANRWSNIDYFDHQFRSFPFMFASGNQLYFGGGTTDSGKTALHSFSAYDIGGQKLRGLRRLPLGTAMGAIAMRLNDSVVILAGGCVRDSCNPHIYSYNLPRDEWTIIAENRQPGRFGFAFLLDSCLYTGMQAIDELSLTSDCWKLDLRNGRWSPAPAFTGKARSRVVCGVIDEHRAFVGLGTRASIATSYHPSRFGRIMHSQSRVAASFFRDLYVFDVRDSQWTALPPMNNARRSAIAFVLGGYLYVGMGNVGNKAVRDFSRLRL